MSTRSVNDLRTFRDTSVPGPDRFAAAKRLEAEKDTEVVPDLVDLLSNDPDSWVKGMSAGILAAIGDSRAVAPLVAELAKTRPALGPNGCYQYSTDGDSYFESLARLGDPGFHALVGIIRERRDIRRGEMLWALFSNYKERAYDPAVEALDDIEGVRGRACRVLGWIGDRRALPLLLTALKDPETRTAATTALGDLNHPDAIVPLQDAMVACSDKDKEYILEVIGKIKKNA